MLTPRFDDALLLAADLHRGDVRKGSPTPYVAHLLSVCALVLADGGSEDEAIGALLHDALEDHAEEITAAEIERRFGARVRAIVEACSDTPAGFGGGPKPPWHERKRAYLAHLAGPLPDGGRVAAADKLDNARQTLADVRRLGDALWARFNAGRDDQLGFYRGVVAALRAGGHGGGIVDELDRTVEALVVAATGQHARP